jgi:transcriptional regulator with XRE-family HTH domain
MPATPLTDALLPHLGAAFRLMREQRKMKQYELARRARMGKSQVSLYENGKQAPNFEAVLRLLAALDATFHDLHNALKFVEGKLSEVCPGPKRPPDGETIEKFSVGLSLLLQASHGLL